MDVALPRTRRRLALAATAAAGVVVAAALAAAVYLPGALDFSARPDPTGTRTVTWVAPDGPAWGAGVLPGDRVVGWLSHGPGAGGLVVQAGKRRIVLEPEATTVDPLDIPVAGLGVLVLVMGAVVVAKGRDRDAATAFWRMSLAAGLALGVTPAGFHGLPWAIALTFAALSLFGPALLDLALTFPAMGTATPLRRAIWLPALALVALYPFCWWRPVPLFAGVQIAGDALLVIYILAACVRLGWVPRRWQSPLQQAQLDWLALGIIGGFTPMVALNLVPYILTGRGVAPIQLSILPLALLPVSVAIAIVRVEFLGITSLLRRHPLHLVLDGALLLGVAVIAGVLVEAGPRRWGWPAGANAAAACVLTVLGFVALRPTLTRWGEHLVLHDVYDTGDILRRLSRDLAQAPPTTRGAIVVTRLSHALNLTDALLLTPATQWSYAHPRATGAVATREAVAQRALRLFAAPPPREGFVERVAGQPILFLPIGSGPDVRAVLCLGPKRGADPYTAQDRALLDTLVRHLALLFADQQPHARRVAPSPTPSFPAASTSTPVAIRTDAGPSLTARELETLRYLVEGLTNKEIARRMVVGEKTVQKHVRAIFAKLDAHTRTQAVTIACRTHLLPPD